MADRNSSKKNDELKKAYFSRVSERTRSKTNVYLAEELRATLSPSEECIREQKKRKRQMKQAPVPSVSGKRRKSGKHKADTDTDLGIERIDKFEFLNGKRCSSSRIQGVDKGLKNVQIGSKRPFATVQISRGDQKGNDDEDSESESIERISKAEFIARVSFSMSGVGSTSKEKLNETSCAATNKKVASNAGKRETSIGYCESFSPKDISDHARPHASNSPVQIESDSDNTISDLQRIVKQKTPFKSKTGNSVKQGSRAASLSKIAGGARNNISSADHSISSAHRDYFNDSDTQKSPEKVPSLVKSNDDSASIERIDEFQFKNRKRQFVPEMGEEKASDAEEDEVSSYSAKQKKSANQTRSKKPAEVCNESPSTDSDASSTDNGYDTLDEDFEVNSSDDDEELLGSDVEEDEVQEENEQTDRDHHHNADAEEGLKERENSKNTSNKCLNQFNSPKDGYDHNGDGPQERTGATSSGSSVPAKNKILLTGNEKKVQIEPEPKVVAPSSHSKDNYDHITLGTDKRTEVTTSHSHIHANKMTARIANGEKMPIRPNEEAPPSHLKELHDHVDDGTKERTGVTSSRSLLCGKNQTVDIANEKEVPTGPKEAAGPSHSDDGIKEKTRATGSSSLPRVKKKTANIIDENKVPTRPKEAAHPSHSKDFVKERTGTTNSVSAVFSNVPTRAKEASPPSQSNHTEERTGRISSGSRVHDDKESVDLAHEMELLTGRKPVSSKRVKDVCSKLADAVLRSRPIPANEDIFEKAEQAPAPQTQDTLPQKFKFEDEVPKLEEETEYEKGMNKLWSDLDRDWELDEMQPVEYPEDNFENENSHAEETQHARCCRGKHELILEEDEGLICRFCRHEELGAKDVMPEWAEATYRHSERRRYTEKEAHLDFDELDMHLSTNGDADIRNSSDATGTVWNIKPGVRESMYEHQREGFEFLWKNLAGSININEVKSANPVDVGGCIISHAPGTGKTRLTMVFVETYFKMFPNCRPMIISPASTLLTWEEEFKKWKVEFPFHNLGNVDLSGKENKTALRLLHHNKIRDKDSIRMMKLCSWDLGRSILGISYSLFTKLTGEGNTEKKKNKKWGTLEENVRKILLEKPGLVVLDEGHTPRNQRSSIWNVLLKLKTDKRIILSGTPFQNNFGELFNTLRIVRPAKADMLEQEKTFAEVVAPRRKDMRVLQSPLLSEVVDRAVENLKACMVPFVHLHKGTILKQSLPGLRDCVVLLKPPALQKSLIGRLEGSNNTFKHEHDVAVISVHPHLFIHCESNDDRRIGIDMDAVEKSKLNPQEGAKTRFLMELVQLSMKVEEKVLVFSQFIQPLELIKEQLKEVFKWAEGRQILHLQGRQCQKQRQALINTFNDPQSESYIMLASTKCCSEGISLTGASRVVLLDVVWNPSVERQAICRAYRIGQKKFVHTYHLMTSGTSEGEKYIRQAEKERLSELVFSSSKESSSQQNHPSPVIEDDILGLMLGHENLKGMFEKIINQPKDTDLIQSFGLTS